MTENQNNPGLSCAWHIQQNATQRDTSLKCEIVTQFSDANCAKALLAYYGCGEGGDDQLRSFFCKRVQCPKLLTRILQLNNFLSPPCPRALLECYGCGEGGENQLRPFVAKKMQCPKLLTRIAQLNNFLNPLATEHCWNSMIVEREVTTK